MKIAEREEAGIDFTALLNAAIEEKRAEEHAEEVKRYEAEAIPEGETLTGWNTTPEEIARINAGDREAVNRFYFDERNYEHIKFCGFSFFRKEQRFKSIINIDDLMQQVYVDLASGMIKLRAFDRGISGAIYTSFRFAPVGGLDEVFIVSERRLKRWAKGRN